MPVVSRAQNAAMHEAEDGKSTLGIPPSVGKEFVEASHGESVSSLPEHVGGGSEDEDDEHTKEMRGRADHLHKQGLISAGHHKKLHEQITAMAKARRPNLAGAGDGSDLGQPSEGATDAAEDGESPPKKKMA